ncbi:hypothetical protein MPRM_26250 [Mycobacterium parmense]|uniref:Uncharacterized protein n=1 Tax=Mycobacterium parmense TaxID=185642 RepID=A0A7I7YWK0_9MYCO|nr:hypothetical protein AWC20_07285 [Mycobacterium parmense]BBZ45344.1 hypothetical protein MPRM_26250 [Mycobacterium parmense]
MATLDTPADGTQLRRVLRGAASALKENGPRFALAGSYALWAYGAPEPSHDVDLVVAESDVAGAVATLTDAGFSVERTPEDRRCGSGWTGIASKSKPPTITTPRLSCYSRSGLG